MQEKIIIGITDYFDREEYFDKKEREDWICTIEGVAGQTLKVFDDYLIIITTEDFDE